MRWTDAGYLLTCDVDIPTPWAITYKCSQYECAIAIYVYKSSTILKYATRHLKRIFVQHNSVLTADLPEFLFLGNHLSPGVCRNIRFLKQTGRLAIGTANQASNLMPFMLELAVKADIRQPS